ncbi:MAG: hypothetical protein NTY30_04815 [Candidatus Berkelbacteria bacterium]|nr:hypothetical protein [Candidatus Berkelbacteria bacterium]
MLKESDPTGELPDENLFWHRVVEIGKSAPDKFFNYELSKGLNNQLLIKVIIGGGHHNPDVRLVGILKRVAKEFGFENCEIIYRDPNITNYDEPKTPEPPVKTRIVRDPSNGEEYQAPLHR